MFDSPTFDPNAEMLNDKKQTPLHLVVKAKCRKDVGIAVLSALLQRNLIDPNIRDQYGKRPIDYLSNRNDDDYHSMLEEAMVTQYKQDSSPFPGYESLPSDEKLDYLMKIILEKAPLVPVQNAKQHRADHELFNLSSDSVHGHQCIAEVEDHQTDATDVKMKEKELDDYKERVTKVRNRFDTLLWEVEVTPKVVEFFKDTKKNSAKNRLAAARTICKLAEGMRNEHLSKRIGNNVKSLHLFEARMTHGSRILWEEAISYSAKLSSQNDQVYSRVIRVWEIVLSHDDVGRRIRQIEKSHRRGSEASLNFKWFLMPQKEIKRGERAIPDKFIPITEEDRTQIKHRFIPAASTKDDQYNVTIFHSFDASTIKSLLLGANDRMEFPFKEWRKENEIIRLNTKEAILVLGRSGTGKTTCCLYRLWNEFNVFWNPEICTAYLKIPRKCSILPSILEGTSDDSGQKQSVTELDDLTNESDLLTESKCEYHTQNEELLSCKDNAADVESTEGKDNDSPTSSIHHKVVTDKQSVEESSASCLPDEAKLEEKLHQVFVTKNRILCDYMKTSFYNMAAACDFLESHMKYENAVLPNSFSQICDEAFPLFLTARQFFILLDNSLGDTSTYFPRNKDGNIRIKITSTDYDDDYRKMVLRLQGSNATSSPTKQWVEVTALYFKDHIWRKISYQRVQKGKEFEPMLVWTEIQSFIKGSESALRKGNLSAVNSTRYLVIAWLLAMLLIVMPFMIFS